MARLRGTTPSHSRALGLGERRDLQRLLAEVPIGADCHDPRVVAFCDRWREYHVVHVHGIVSVHSLRCTRSARPELLESLRIALDDPMLTITAKANCRCFRCYDVRGGR